MKNYIPLYIIILLVVGVLFMGMMEFASIESELLLPAQAMIDKISLGEPVEEDYNNLCATFDRHETVINMFINHSVYSNIMICLEEIGIDIEYNRTAELKSDAKRLAYYLEDITDGEKIKINNIF